MNKTFLLVTGMLILFATEILRVYFIMPFPGSQHRDTINVAYFIDRNIWWFRIIGLVITIPPLIYFLRRGKTLQKIVVTVTVLAYVFIFYMFNFRFLADKMFHQPKQIVFADLRYDTAHQDQLVVGVSLNGESKAYPVEVIGYHHQVKDTLGHQPIMVTYCTVCRTGRVYSPVVNGKVEMFRLVGMDHFNAMFEDATTKSWWQQATGQAIAGPLKGTRLPEIPSSQMRLGDWLALHPNSVVMRRDTNYTAKYDSLKGYDEGTIEGSLEHRDTASWKFKSWVIGVPLGDQSRAYDWNRLVRERVITDTLGNRPLLITLEPNNKTFYVFSPADSLHFTYDSATKRLNETRTGSSWRLNGICVSGPLAGQKMEQLQAYQEFWHSWQSFHPNSSAYQHEY